MQTLLYEIISFSEMKTFTTKSCGEDFKNRLFGQYQ